MATERISQLKQPARRREVLVSPVKRVKSQSKYPIKLRGRQFSYRDICTIRKCIKKLFDCGRTRISVELCEELEWKQPNGWPKDRACREVLRKLEKMNLIKLPPQRKTSGPQNQQLPKLRTRFVYKPVTPANGITLEFAKGNAAEKSWNALVSQNHYLGHRIVVGRCLKYLIKHEGLIIGAIAFSSAAWTVETRDRILAQLGMSTKDIRESVINNCRFLMLANARKKNLASRALAASTKQAAHDWEQFYSIKPLIVETFVLPSRFKGTCYKAANWIEIGLTKGYAKRGTSHCNSQEPKKVFLYGLNRQIRKKLTLQRSTIQ